MSLKLSLEYIYIYNIRLTYTEFCVRSRSTQVHRSWHQLQLYIFNQVWVRIHHRPVSNPTHLHLHPYFSRITIASQPHGKWQPQQPLPTKPWLMQLDKMVMHRSSNTIRDESEAGEIMWNQWNQTYTKP